MKIRGRFKKGGGRHAAGEVIDSRSLRQKAGDMFDRTFKSILGEKKFAKLQERSFYKSKGAYLAGKGGPNFMKNPLYADFLSYGHLTGAFGSKVQKDAFNYHLQKGTIKLGGSLAGMSEADKDVLKELNPKTRSMQLRGRPIAPMVTRVNDMIMTKDGQMIETHPDDNLIAKKGNITQTTGGNGKSRVEELLEELIMVTREGGNISIDGTKVSSAVNSANYRL